MSSGCAQAPLVDLMRRIPEDTRCEYNAGEFYGMQETPVGYYLHKGADRIIALEAENKRFRAALQDFKENGIRADLMPTNAHLWDVAQFYQYLKGIDECLRQAACDALDDKPEEKETALEPLRLDLTGFNTEGFRWLDIRGSKDNVKMFGAPNPSGPWVELKKRIGDAKETENNDSR